MRARMSGLPFTELTIQGHRATNVMRILTLFSLPPSMPHSLSALTFSAFIALMLLPAGLQAQSNPGKLVFYRELTWQLFVINTDGTGQTSLTSGGNLRDANPAFSPDGTRIAFDRNISLETHVFVMNATGTNPVAITSGASTNVEPSWSPNGQKLVFVSSRSGTRRREIWVVNADGTGLVQLTTNVQLGSDSSGPIYSGDFNPSWSPDGSSIAFASDRNGLSNAEIYVMNVDGTNQTRLTNITTYDRSPTWSPDSQRIGFESGFGNGINIMNRDGSNIVNATRDGFNATWSPDGEKFAFNRYDSSTGEFQIFIMNVDGTNAIKVTNNAFDSLAPNWAPASSSPVPTSNISGHVRDGGGNPITAATLTLTGPVGTPPRTAQTDGNGSYSFAGLPFGSYRIDIAKPGFGFIPTSIDITNLSSDRTIDFIGYVAFSISGQVTGLDGNSIQVRVSGSQDRSVFTDSNGNYSFEILPGGGDYSVTITNSIWNTSPGSYTFNNLSTNQTANFSAVRATYTISGRITRLGNPLPGISVGLNNLTGNPPITTNSDSNGQYSFTGVRAGGNYIVRPVGANYNFNPQTWDFNQLSSNKTADFVGLSANHLGFNTRYVFGGASNNCNVVLNVLRGGNAQGVGPITVRYATKDDSAIAGSDYVAVSGTLNFPEGTFSQTVTIPLLAGQATGAPRTFVVTLSNPTGEVDLGEPSSVTIVLTDPAPPSSLVLATQPNTNRAVALNASNQVAEPFSPLTPINFSQDPKTRLSFFVSGVQFNACQGTNSLIFSGMDSQQHSFSGTVEQVLKLPGNNPYLQFNIQLPEGFITGDWTIRFSLGNLTTNTVLFSTRP